MTAASSRNPRRSGSRERTTVRTVLVTTATGTVGRHVVQELIDRDAAIRAGSREPAAVRDRFATGVDPVEFDFGKPETWGRALEDVERVFLVRPPGVAVSDLRAFVDAAERVGVTRIVYLSTLGADRNPLVPHYWIERHLERSGMEHVSLRASFFMQNLHEVHARDVIEHDELFVPAGSGETSFVDARDVGAVATGLLAESGRPSGAYELTGPEALGYDEVAAIFTDVLDREITYADPSIRSFVARARSQGYPLGYVVLMVGIYTTARIGLAGRVTDDVERLLGRPPRSVRDYVEDYADRFRDEASVNAPATDESDTRVAGDSGTRADSGRVTEADRPPRWLTRAVNPLVERLLRSPLHGLVSDELLVLTVTGRKSATEYTFPVGYERRGETVYVTSHGTTWPKNLRDGGQRVIVLLRGTRRTGHAEVIEDDERVAEFLHGYLERNGVAAARRVGLDIEGETVPEEATLRDAVGHVVVVRIRLESGRSA